jgi:predicted porin
MRLTIFAVFFIFASLSTSATAQVDGQAHNFEGTDFQLGIGYQYSKGNASLQDATNSNGSVARANMGSVGASIGLSYTAAINNKYTLGGILESNPLKLKAGSANVNFPTPYTVSSYDETFKNVYSLSFEPGYAIDFTKLIYAKFGYSSSSSIFNSNDGSANSTLKLNGYNVGLGLRFDTGVIYPFAELNYIKFNPNNYSVSTTGILNQSGTGFNLITGIGYHF